MRNQDNFFIYGRKPVEEALLDKAQEIDKIFIKNSINASSYKNLNEAALINRVPIVKVPDQKIHSLVGRVNHQGFVAQVSLIKYLNFFEWIETLDLASNPAVILLDGIEDPHNLGAILRSAVAAGISAVLVPTQNQAPVNATVFKTSAGTATKISIIRVHDTKQGFKDLKLAGFSILGLDMSAKETIWESDFEKPIAFLIGNEGKGIDRELIAKCDQLAMLPMERSVESLNASVTAALISYEWKRKKLAID
ncbi:MAG: 23S rRNA (guanosine(2251)-2'-O)-methyltransferase RlmB [Balneola sp.]|nr:MAG: 23S rRNA (guanosine(2251)-2'-O)-methyltransferase RlmB [Balneola sp.]